MRAIRPGFSVDGGYQMVAPVIRLNAGPYEFDEKRRDWQRWSSAAFFKSNWLDKLRPSVQRFKFIFGDLTTSKSRKTLFWLPAGPVRGSRQIRDVNLGAKRMQVGGDDGRRRIRIGLDANCRSHTVTVALRMQSIAS